MADVSIGSLLGHYRVLERIGGGGMGVVFKARDERLRRTVAIKVLGELLATDDEHRRRFIREARLAASITHPNIVSIYDVGETDDGRIYVAMELVDGITLRERLTQPLDMATALRIARDLLRGMAKAHEHGVVHRDLKPSNIVIGADHHVKVLDFGLAKPMTTEAAPPGDDRGELETLPPATLRGSPMGTPGYMSPEQASGSETGEESDVFTLGIILYELTTGRRPFEGTSALALILATVREAPTPPSALNPRVAAELEGVILRCLEKKPESRYASARELLAALEAAVPFLSDTSLPRIPSAPATRRWPAIAVGAVAAAVLGALALRPSLRHPATTPSPPPPAMATFEPWGEHCPNAEADGILQEAMRLYRRAGPLATTKLSEAAKLDPACGAAEVRLLTANFFTDLELSRPFYVSALRLRDRLDEHDRALLAALEPAFGPDSDLTETARRLGAAIERFPHSVELLHVLAMLHLGRSETVLAEEASVRMQAADPEFAPGYADQAWALSLRGDVPASERVVAACLVRVPLAPSCLDADEQDLEYLERCSDAERLAQTWRDTNPEPAWPPILLAGLRLGMGATTVAAEELLAEARARAGGSREVVGDVEAAECRLAELLGDFSTADACRARRDEGCKASRECHLEELGRRLLGMLESGRTAAAKALADSALRRADAWSRSGPDAEDLLELRILSGRLSDDAIGRAFAARLAALGALEHNETKAWDRAAWRLVFLAPERKEPASSLPAALDPLWDGTKIHEPPIGVALARADRGREARAALRHELHRCNVLDDPLQGTIAIAELGRLCERERDTECAREAYGKVVARWGNAKPRSLTAEDARRRLAAIAR